MCMRWTLSEFGRGFIEAHGISTGACGSSVVYMCSNSSLKFFLILGSFYFCLLLIIRDDNMDIS
jgi:hypothetical protein